MFGYDLECLSKCCWLFAPATKGVPNVLAYCIDGVVVVVVVALDEDELDELDEDEVELDEPSHTGICMFSPCRLKNVCLHFGHTGTSGGGGVVFLLFLDCVTVGIPKHFPILFLSRVLSF